MPTNTAAWLLARQAPLVVKSAPYTHPREGEIVVKNRAVAINPVDWGVQLLGNLIFPWFRYPFILGTDLAGEVVEVGEGVTRFSVGDRVLGIALGMDKTRNSSAEGAFQEYTVLLAHMAAPIPSTMSYEDAAVLPLALYTAAFGLFQKDHLALQYPSAAHQPTGKTLLIWGGSTSVGSNAIQLAVAAGYEVITTSSPRNFPYVRRLGASQVFDYHEKTVVADIIEALKGKTIAGALAIGAGSADACSAIVHVCNGDKFVSLVSLGALPPRPGLNLQTLLLIFRFVSANVSFQVTSRRKHRSWLLILDNVEHPQEILSTFATTQHHGSILLTTRVHDVEPFAQTQVLSTMSEDEGILFLLRRTKKSRHKSWPGSGRRRAAGGSSSDLATHGWTAARARPGRRLYPGDRLFILRVPRAVCPPACRTPGSEGQAIHRSRGVG